MNNLTLQIKELEKAEHKASRTKKIIIRAEINKIENRKIEKIIK